ILVKVGADSLVSIVEKNADAKMYPASMTKVMTLVVACERVTDLDKKLEVTAEIAKFAEDNDGSGAGLKVGESYTVKDLLYLISYKSDTIASMLIAEHIAGSEMAFVSLMNEKAQQLGLNGTHFANCTGLYHEENYSTCRDIATIMAYALDNEMAFKVLSSYEGYAMTVGGVDCKFYSGWYSGKARFADNPRLSTVTVKAAKTGYIDESGISLVSYAVGKDGSKYINVIVGQPKGSGLTESMSTAEVKLIYNTYAK
ncbi:MAG: D-alanyl-D-alanine carboxypeptidase, partial [Clostridia bacterium]|nr:D-alanyl-D-alanine carboxypeptidase [Clostridia bacterium]